jgi:hypothetical protein
MKHKIFVRFETKKNNWNELIKEHNKKNKKDANINI